MKLGENETSYEIEEATWNGYGWNSEKGYFTINGIVRFADTPMEIFESYDDIDTDILADCIEFADED